MKPSFISASFHTPVSGVLAAVLAIGLVSAPGANPVYAQAVSDLSTKTENSLGVSLTNYKYKEPNVMQLKARKAGIDYAGTYAFGSSWPNSDQGWFFRGEARYAFGNADYSSPISGSIDNTKDWYYELRGLFGRDVSMGSYVLSPYAGLGFRYLYNDLRFSDTCLNGQGGTRGYQRISTYQSAVLGLTHKVKTSGGAQLISSVEYMHLIKGKQKANLSEDTCRNPRDPNVSLNQNKGYGLRLTTAWRSGPWSVGPTITYWDIEQSATVSNWFEPKNTTLEVGLKGSYHF
jgi:hypothetical protein